MCINWNNKTNNLIRLNEKETLFNRLDRSYLNSMNDNIKKNIIAGKYSDYHCLRPNTKYLKINWEIYNLLTTKSSL